MIAAWLCAFIFILTLCVWIVVKFGGEPKPKVVTRKKPRSKMKNYRKGA